MKSDLDKAKQRAYRYWYVDGLNEIFFGLICLFLGGFYWLQDHLPESSWLKPVLIIFLILFILGSSILLRKAINAVKNRVTYPRTGYVSYPQPKRKHNWLAGLLGMGISALLVIILNKLPGSTNWMPAITGVVFAIVMLVIGWRLELARFYLIGISALILGGGLSFVGIGDVNGLSIFNGGIGLVLIISGSWVLLRYLNRTAQPEDGSDA